MDKKEIETVAKCVRKQQSQFLICFFGKLGYTISKNGTKEIFYESIGDRC